MSVTLDYEIVQGIVIQCLKEDYTFLKNNVKNYSKKLTALTDVDIANLAADITNLNAISTVLKYYLTNNEYETFMNSFEKE